MIDVNSRRRLLDEARAKNLQTNVVSELSQKIDSKNDSATLQQPLGSIEKSSKNQTTIGGVTMTILQKIMNFLPQMLQQLPSKEDISDIKKEIQAITFPIPPDEILLDANQVQKLTQAIGNVKFPDIPEKVSLKEINTLLQALEGVKQAVTDLDLSVDKVDVGSIDSMPPTTVTNLREVTQGLAPLIANLQVAVVKAIVDSKVTPKSEVRITNFNDLLDAMEELKKGFNLLINKETATVAFPDKAIPVNIENWMLPQPVTNMSVNAVNGFIKTTAATVTASLTPLPTYGVLSSRRSMIIYNNSTQTVYVGGSDVTTSNGLPVPKNTYSPPFDNGTKTILYGVVASGSADVRCCEISDINTGR
jgi:hypothetical protein